MPPLRQTFVLEDPDVFSVRQTEPGDDLRQSAGDFAREELGAVHPGLVCKVCHGPLGFRKFRVCSDECARKRKSQLQRSARRRARR